MADPTRDIASSNPTAAQLGINLDQGTVDGEHVGTYMARVAYKLRRRNARHYINRAPTHPNSS